jgi:hypothetical protein
MRRDRVGGGVLGYVAFSLSMERQLLLSRDFEVVWMVEQEFLCAVRGV